MIVPAFARSSPSTVLKWLRRAGLVTLALLALGFALTRVLAQRAERKFPALGRRVAIDGLEQHVIERGAGPPIVFVHGAFGAAQDFLYTVFEGLEDRYRCVAWDRPGHGYSERSDGPTDPGTQARILLGVIRELGLERPLLVSYSFGGAVILAAGLEAPSELRGLVLLNGPSHPWPGPLGFEYVLPGIPVLGPILSETWIMPIGLLRAPMSAKTVFDPLSVPTTFGASPTALALRPRSFRANGEDIRSLKPFLRAQSERYAELALPVTLVVSEEDGVVSPTLHSSQLAAAAPNCTTIRVPGVGHQILYSRPELVVELIEAAMQR